MSRSVLKPVPTASEQLEALLGYPWPFPGRPQRHDRSTWTVTDDWQECVPEVARLRQTLGGRSGTLLTHSSYTTSWDTTVGYGVPPER